MTRELHHENAYAFLHDEDELKKFCENVLPELKTNEYLYIMLGARRKYLLEYEKDNYNMNGTDMLERIVLKSSSFESVKRAIKKLCIPVGTYTDKNGKPLPHHCFTVYMTVNPSCGKMASANLIKKLTDMFVNNDPNFNVASHALTEMHKAVGRKNIMDFDIDPINEEELKDAITFITESLGKSRTHTVKTRTGAHVLLHKDDIDPAVRNYFYNAIREYSDKNMEGEIEIRGHAMVPVPGAYQGDHIPYLIDCL